MGIAETISQVYNKVAGIAPTNYIRDVTPQATVMANEARNKGFPTTVNVGTSSQPTVYVPPQPSPQPQIIRDTSGNVSGYYLPNGQAFLGNAKDVAEMMRTPDFQNSYNQGLAQQNLAIKDYATQHATELNRVFTGDYYPQSWEIQQGQNINDAIINKLGSPRIGETVGENIARVKKSDQDVVNTFKQMFGGDKSFEQTKLDWQKAGETRMDEFERLSQSNIKTEAERLGTTYTPDTSWTGYYKDIGKNILIQNSNPILNFLGVSKQVQGVSLNPIGVYQATLKPAYDIATTPLGSQYSSSLTQDTLNKLYSNMNSIVPLGVQTYSKAFLEKEAIIRNSNEINSKSGEIQTKLDNIAKDYSNGLLTDKEYVDKIVNIQTSKDYQMLIGFNNLKSKEGEIAKYGNPAQNFFGATFAGAGQLLPLVSPIGWVSKVASVEFMGRGGEQIQNTVQKPFDINTTPLQIGSGLVSIAMGASGFMPVKVPKGSEISNPGIFATKIKPVIPYAITGGFLGVQGVSTYQRTGRISAALGSVTPGAIAFFGVPAVQYENQKQYVEIPIKNKAQLKETGAFIHNKPVYTVEGTNIRIPLSTAQYNEVISNGRIVQSYPRYKLQLKSALQSKPDLTPMGAFNPLSIVDNVGKNWVPKPSYSGSPYGGTYILGKGKIYEVSKAQALSERTRAVKNLMNDYGLTPSQANTFLRYTPPKDILNYGIGEGIQVQTTRMKPVSAEIITKQYSIKLATKGTFTDLFGIKQTVNVPGFNIRDIAPSLTTQQILSPSSVKYIGSNFNPFRTLTTSASLARTEDFDRLLKNPNWMKNNPDKVSILRDLKNEGLVTNYWKENTIVRNPNSKIVSEQYNIKPVSKVVEVLQLPTGATKLSYIDKSGRVAIRSQGATADEFNNPSGQWKRAQVTNQKGYEFTLTKGGNIGGNIALQNKFIISGTKTIQTSQGGSPTYINKVLESASRGRVKEITNTYSTKVGQAELTTDWGVQGSTGSGMRLISSKVRHLSQAKAIATYGDKTIVSILNPFQDMKKIEVIGDAKITNLYPGSYNYKSGGYASQRGRAGSPFPIIDKAESLSFKNPSSPWNLGGGSGPDTSSGSSFGTPSSPGRSPIVTAKTLNSIVPTTIPVPSLVSTTRNSAMLGSLVAPSITTSILNPVVIQLPTTISRSVLTPIMTPVSTPIMIPIVTPVVIPGTISTPVATPIMTPVSTPVMTPVMTPIVTPVVTPIVTPVINLTPLMNFVPKPSTHTSRIFYSFVGSTSSKSKKGKIKPTPKGFYVLTMKQKKPFLITPQPLVKEQALSFGVAYTKKNERATFKLIPAKRAAVNINIKPMTEQQVWLSGYRPPVKGSSYIKGMNVFIQKKPTRMSNRKEYKAIQSYKTRGKTLW